MAGSSTSAKKASSLFYAELVELRVGAEKLSDYLFLLFSSRKNLLSHFNFVFKSGCWREIKFTPFRVGAKEFDFFNLRNQRTFSRFFLMQKAPKSVEFLKTERIQNTFLKTAFYRQYLIMWISKHSPLTHWPLTSCQNSIFAAVWKNANCHSFTIYHLKFTIHSLPIHSIPQTRFNENSCLNFSY